MLRLGIVIVLGALVACGGKGKQDTASAGSGSAIYAKKMAISWGLEDHDGAKADIFLQTTDETGKQTSYPLGTYDGACKVFTPAPEMKALTGVSCTTDQGATELHAVVDGEQVIILKLIVQKGTTPDPMSRTEVTRVAAPTGAKVEVGA
jgi:hypothetical protein